jgi:putative sigma-54 modulation protein
MQIDIKGRNVPVTDELRARLERRCRKVSRQVSEFARLEVEIYEERNPSIADRQVAEATLYLKGVTLRARDASREMDHSLKLVSLELARQVKRHRDKRRHRREARSSAPESVPHRLEATDLQSAS